MAQTTGGIVYERPLGADSCSNIVSFPYTVWAKNCTFILLSVKERFEGEKKAASIISLQSVRCRVAYVLHKTVLITTDINITAIPMTI